MELHVASPTGEAKTIEAQAGTTLMEAIRMSGFEEMLALCGGCCSCSTCQVYVDEAQLPMLQPMKGDEDDLLDSSSHRQANSRLACQIVLTDELGGLSIIIAPED